MLEIAIECMHEEDNIAPQGMAEFHTLRHM